MTVASHCYHLVITHDSSPSPHRLNVCQFANVFIIHMFFIRSKSRTVKIFCVNISEVLIVRFCPKFSLTYINEISSALVRKREKMDCFTNSESILYC